MIGAQAVELRTTVWKNTSSKPSGCLTHSFASPCFDAALYLACVLDLKFTSSYKSKQLHPRQVCYKVFLAFLSSFLVARLSLKTRVYTKQISL